jgi:Rrf2 family protein
MKLSTKGRYGLKAMLDIALNMNDGVVAIKNISKRQGISEPYLEQLFSALKKAGLVKSTRGSMGGYVLASSPEQITVGQVLRALEGSLAPVDCVLETDAHQCDRVDCCVVKGVWAKIRDSINEVVDSITLSDLVEDYKKLNQDTGYMFYI